MFPKIFKKNKISSNSVGIYLFTLIIIIFSSPFYVGTQFEGIITNSSFVLNILASVYIIIRATGKKWIAILGFLIVLLFVIDLLLLTENIGYIANYSFIIISLIALFYIYVSIFNLKSSSLSLSKDILYAAIAGYLFIGVFGYVLLIQIYESDPNAIVSNSLSHLERFDIKYFSFVTLTSLGYGDISPVSDKAKSISVLIALVGQLYLTIVMAMIVSEFLSTKRK